MPSQQSRHLVHSRVNEGNEVLLVSHRDCVAIRRPGDVDVFSLCVNGRDRLVVPGVPDPDCLVTTSRGQQVCLARMPAQLVHRIAVTAESVFLGQAVGTLGQAEDTNGLVVRTWKIS